MDKATENRLRAGGWRVGSAADFLELSAQEIAFVQLKVALADLLRDTRVRHGWTQVQVAQQLGSSQSRIAKMEAADATVSLDLLVRSLLALGTSRQEVGRVISHAV